MPLEKVEHGGIWRGERDVFSYPAFSSILPIQKQHRSPQCHSLFLIPWWKTSMDRPGLSETPTVSVQAHPGQRGPSLLGVGLGDL